MTPRVITESTTEPIELAEAILNIKAFPSSPEVVVGGRLARLITAARRVCEEELDMSLVAKTLEVSQSSFCPYPIELSLGPVRSVDSVRYLNSDGVDTPLDADQYRVIRRDEADWLLPAYNVTWPTARCDADSVRVQYTVGYPSTDSPPVTVPEPIRQAMHLLIAHYFAKREAVDVDTMVELPLGVRYLLGKYRRGLGV